MNTQHAISPAVNTQTQHQQETTQSCTPNGSTTQTTWTQERHFLIPEFKVRVVKSNQSFELGYN